MSSGGSGNKALAYLRRYPDLHAVILDLPAAVEVSAPVLRIVAGEDNSRIAWRAEDARTADLGDGEYDVIVAFSFLYALTSAQNADLLHRCARALRPGGLLVVATISSTPTRATVANIPPA